MITLKSNIGLFYHPSTVILVDDNEKYLNFLFSTLPETHNNYKLFGNPNLACEYFENYQELQPNIIESNSIENEEFSFKIQAISNEIYNGKRFDRVSTIFVDYEMQGLNGLEVLRYVKSENINRILLTGVADEKIAIEAFNEGLIDRYIKKHDPDIIELIERIFA